jgi:hypothetical protein
MDKTTTFFGPLLGHHQVVYDYYGRLKCSVEEGAGGGAISRYHSLHI